MAIDEDFDPGNEDLDAVPEYVCSASGITGREIDSFVTLEAGCCDEERAEHIIPKHGKTEQDVRRSMYAHLLQCRECRTVYVGTVKVYEAIGSMREDILSAQADGVPLKNILQAIGMRPEAAEACEKAKKKGSN